MTEVPDGLAALRAETQASSGWRVSGRLFSQAAYEASTQAERAKMRWLPDPELLAALCVAERQWGEQVGSASARLERGMVESP